MALFPQKVNKVQGIYYSALKTALGVPRNVNNNELNKALNLVDLRTTLQSRFFKVYKKLHRKGLIIPEVIQQTATKLCLDLELGLPETVDVAEFAIRGIKKWMTSTHGQGMSPEGLNFPEGLFHIKDEGDWPLLYALVNRLIPGMGYEIKECVHCKERLNQDHLFDVCEWYDARRRRFCGDLARAGITPCLSGRLAEFINHLQTEERIRTLNRSGRDAVLQVTKEYVTDIRKSFLEKIGPSSGNIG